MLGEGKASQARLTWGEKFGYALGDTASVLYYRTFAMFLMIFYTDVYGISAASVSLMFLLTRFWDALNDPAMGMLADRTRSPNGKFRPWLRWMILPYMVSGVLLFTVPDLGAQGKLIYAWVTYVLAGMVYTAVNNPYGALMGVMSEHSSDRTQLASFRFYGAYLGDFIVKGSMIWLVGVLGMGNEAAGYQRTMVVYAVLAGGLFLVTFYATRERVSPPPEQRMNFWKDLSELSRNGPWLAICGMGVCTLIWISVRDGATLYFFKYYVGNYETWAPWFLVLGTVSTFTGVACTDVSTRLCGDKRRAFIVLTLLVAVVSVGFYFVQPEQVLFILLIQVVASFLSGPLMPLFWSMIADTADYGEWKFGRRLTGLTFSAGTFSQKAGWALGGSIAGWMLALHGYEANIEQSAETVGGIKLLMGVVPGVLGGLTAIVGSFYKISAEVEERMAVELEERRTHAKSAGSSLGC